MNPLAWFWGLFGQRASGPIAKSPGLYVSDADFSWAEQAPEFPASSLEESISPKNERLNLKFLPPIPKGMRIWCEAEQVAGLRYRIEAAQQFASGDNQSLTFQFEPTNSHDPNAIMVIGTFSRGNAWKSVHIGYVSAALAGEIAENVHANALVPRLKGIWWSAEDDDFLVVRFDLLGPKLPKKKSV